MTSRNSNAPHIKISVLADERLTGTAAISAPHINGNDDNLGLVVNRELRQHLLAHASV
jgi:hypothetical protein